jgi:hypothetical protein
MRLIAFILIIFSTPAFAGQTVATWYGHEHDGKRTASGEMFNPDGADRRSPITSVWYLLTCKQSEDGAQRFALTTVVPSRREFRSTSRMAPHGLLACVQPRVWRSTGAKKSRYRRSAVVTNHVDLARWPGRPIALSQPDSCGGSRCCTLNARIITARRHHAQYWFWPGRPSLFG